MVSLWYLLLTAYVAILLCALKHLFNPVEAWRFMENAAHSSWAALALIGVAVEDGAGV